MSTLDDLTAERDKLRLRLAELRTIVTNGGDFNEFAAELGQVNMDLGTIERAIWTWEQA